MARKNRLTEQLEGQQSQPQRWQNQIKSDATPAVEKAKPPTKTGTYTRKTFLMTDELIQRIQSVADRENVGQNELVRYLLDLGLQQVEEGSHELPTRPGRNTLGV